MDSFIRDEHEMIVTLITSDPKIADEIFESFKLLCEKKALNHVSYNECWLRELWVGKTSEIQSHYIKARIYAMVPVNIWWLFQEWVQEQAKQYHIDILCSIHREYGVIMKKRAN